MDTLEVVDSLRPFTLFLPVSHKPPNTLVQDHGPEPQAWRKHLYIQYQYPTD
jgi:hypothetical protein